VAYGERVCVHWYDVSKQCGDMARPCSMAAAAAAAAAAAGPGVAVNDWGSPPRLRRPGKPRNLSLHKVVGT
jgi:hypothetical protein